MAFDKILVAVHPQGDQSIALAKAAQVARHCNARLVLQCVVWKPDFSLKLFHPSEDLESMRSSLIQETTDRLERLAGTVDGVEIEQSDVTWGHPFHEAMAAAIEQHRPDLVVVGTSRSDRPTTSEWQLLRSCPAPVLLCHQREWDNPPRLVACVDPGHAHDKTDAVDRAILAVAQRMSESLNQPYELLHAAGMTPPLSGDQPYTYQFRDAQDTSNEAAIRALLPADAADSVKISFSHSTPAEAILAFVETRRFDICVLGLVNRSRWKDLLIGSTPRQVIPRMNCDLLLMPHPGGDEGVDAGPGSPPSS